MIVGNKNDARPKNKRAEVKRRTMLRVGDRVEDEFEYAGGVKYRGRITKDLGSGYFTVLWDHGSYSAESDHHEYHLVKLCIANRYNFIIFQNYDGSVEGKVIPRETYNKLFPGTCSS